MQRKHSIARAGITFTLLSAAFLLAAGPAMSTAEAKDRHGKRHKVEKRHKAHKVKSHKRTKAHRRDHVRHEVKHKRHRGDDHHYREVVRYRDHHRPVRRHVVRHYRPWYRNVRYVTYHNNPFYWHAGLGVYIGGAYIDLEFGNAAPRGYYYYDPYCSESFYTVADYHSHLRYHRHRPTLRVVRIEVCEDDYYYDY